MRLEALTSSKLAIDTRSWSFLWSSCTTSCRTTGPWSPTCPSQINWTIGDSICDVACTILVFNLKLSVRIPVFLQNQIRAKLKLYLVYWNEKYFTFLAFSSSQVVPPFCWLIHFLVRPWVPLTLSVPIHDLVHWLQDDQDSIFAWRILFTSTVAAVIIVSLT